SRDDLDPLVYVPALKADCPEALAILVIDLIEARCEDLLDPVRHLTPSLRRVDIEHDAVNLTTICRKAAGADDLSRPVINLIGDRLPFRHVEPHCWIVDKIQEVRVKEIEPS